MRTFSIVHILLFLLALLINQCAQAQDYVITSRGDTLRGEIRPINFGPERKVQIATKEKRKTVLSIIQVREYLLDGATYRPVKTDRGYVFMKLLRPGYLSVYAFQLENQTSFDGMYLLKRDGSGLEVPNLGFKKVMTKFTSDCSVSKKIDSGELGRKDLNRIVDEYNECINDRTVSQPVAVSDLSTPNLAPWEKLETDLKTAAEFEGKQDALDMVADIKGKISRNEKVPNFLVDGLRKFIDDSPDLLRQLDSALSDLKRQR